MAKATGDGNDSHEFKFIVLHDLSGQEADDVLPKGRGDMAFFAAKPPVRNCVGCFNCWVKTPGVCTIDDRARELAEMVPELDSIIVVSRCVYGGLSPDVKAVMERCVGAILVPFFHIVNGEMHHPTRYRPMEELAYHFYGEGVTPREKEIAGEIAAANAVNLGAKKSAVYFYPTLTHLKEALQ